MNLDAGERGVDGDASRHCLEVFCHDERVALGLEPGVVLFWLILSQPQLRTPSAVGHVDPQDYVRLVLEVLVELFLPGLGNGDHE